nr:Chain A, TRANSLATION INITIATION FACTOR 3 [Geobacillus stearothermophilus]
MSKDFIINEQIRAREVRLIDQNGDQLGIKSKQEALEIAARRNLDLVLVAPNAKPPVCRIMDYGKFRFEQQKKEKEARK